VGVWHGVCVIGGMVGVEVVLLVAVRRVEDFVVVVWRLIADGVDEWDGVIGGGVEWEEGGRDGVLVWAVVVGERVDDGVDECVELVCEREEGVGDAV